MHERAGIVSIGDELTTGARLDTNSTWLSAALHAVGIRTEARVTVGDDAGAIAQAIRGLAARSDIVISTGGLGPTLDDLTREGLAISAGEPLESDPVALEQIRAYFARVGRAMPERNAVQALRPRGGACIRNDHGTAPGLRARIGECDVYCLPGPPSEMIPMFESAVRPDLRPASPSHTRVLHTIGLGESVLAARIEGLMARGREPSVGTTASGGVVSVWVRGRDERAVEADVRVVRERLGNVVFGTGDETLASATIQLLRSGGESLATVESCTGGLLGGAITGVPGSSDVYRGGWVTYTNELKQSQVGVTPVTLASHGAVSAQTAREMAIGGLERGGATRCLAITGVAGPGGGNDTKPVGTVWIACAGQGGVDVRRFQFTGSRDVVRQRSVTASLAVLRLHLIGSADATLLGQVERV